MSASAADPAKKVRTYQDADMEISSIETLIDAKPKVDMGVISATTNAAQKAR